MFVAWPSKAMAHSRELVERLHVMPHYVTCRQLRGERKG